MKLIEEWERGVGFIAVKKHYGWVTGSWDYTFAKLINLGLFGVVAVLIVKIIKTKD